MTIYIKTEIMDTFVEKLKNNPIFHLSLSSKELFHSNFLAWLAEDKNTQALFKKILSTWLGEDTFDYNKSYLYIFRIGLAPTNQSVLFY